MTFRRTALAVAALLTAGLPALAQDGDAGEGPRLNPRLERQARGVPPRAEGTVVVPGRVERAEGDVPRQPEPRVFEQRRQRGGGGAGRGDGGGRGGTIIIDGSRDGRGPRGGQLPPRVIQGRSRGAVVPRRIYPYAYGGFGLGYFYYDPFWSPWGPWGAWGAWGGGYPYGYYGGGHQDDFGRVRLDVRGPRDAQVLVDGYYAGTLDDFDGAFQGIELEGGTYRIEVEADGYERLTFDTRVTDGRKITLHGALKRAEP